MIPVETDKIKLFLEILKAKRRTEGETWTQPSGRKVTKKNGKIVPLPGQGRRKKEEPKKKEKKVSALDEKKYYTKFSKYLDKIKKLTGIGRSEVIRQKIQDSYKQAKETGLIKPNTDFDKFHESYLEYFANKEKWDKHFAKVANMDFSKFKNPNIAKTIAESKRPKGIKKPKKPFDKKIIRMLYEQNKPKEVILESGQPIELNPETRFNEYVVDGKKIITGRQSLTQLPTTNYLSGQLQEKLLTHQKDAVNLAMDKFSQGEKGFLLADGTGAGKTMQALALADSYLKTLDGTKPVIILTESDNILNTAWMNDAKVLGIEINNAKINGFIPGMINITTYSQSEKVKDYPDKGLLIFDEAHNLKNMDGKNAQYIQEAIKDSSHVFNATATPIDKIEQIDYLCDSFGLDSNAVKKAIETKDPIQTALNLTSFFEDVTRKGLMVKREVPMSNMSIDIKDAKFSKDNEAKLQKVLKEIEKTGNKKLFPQARRLLEEFKVEQAMDDIVKDLANGKQVVLFADRVSDSNIMGFDSPGTLPYLEKKLKEKGIPFESVFGGSTSEKERQEVKNKVERFQSGQSKVIIGNPDSMGTGINLDDTKGDAPRTLRILTTPYSAMDTIQILGRINRLKTKSKAEAIFYKHKNDIDDWNIGILKDKLTTLGASVGGDYAEIDLDKQGIPTKGATKEPPPINIDDYKKQGEEVEQVEKSGINLDIFRRFFQILKARTVKYFKRIPNPSGGKQKWKYFYTQAQWNKHTAKHHKDNPHHPDITKEAIDRTVKESSQPKKPAFSLEQESKTFGEKKNQSEHSQGKLFGRTGKEKFVKKDFRPKVAEPETIIPSEYVTSIKNLLLKEGLDNRAKEFIGEAMKARDLNDIKEIASRYVDMPKQKYEGSDSFFKRIGDYADREYDIRYDQGLTEARNRSVSAKLDRGEISYRDYRIMQYLFGWQKENARSSQTNPKDNTLRKLYEKNIETIIKDIERIEKIKLPEQPPEIVDNFDTMPESEQEKKIQLSDYPKESIDIATNLSREQIEKEINLYQKELTQAINKKSQLIKNKDRATAREAGYEQIIQSRGDMIRHRKQALEILDNNLLLVDSVSKNKVDKPTESSPEAKKTINPRYLPNENQWKAIQEGNSDTLTRFANKLWTESGEPSPLANSINKGRLDQDSLNDAKQEAMILLWQKHQAGAFKEATPRNLVSYLNKVLHFKINEVSKLQNKQVLGSDFLDKIEVEHGINPEDEYIQKEDLKEQVKNIAEQIETMKQAVVATQKNQWSTSERNQKVWDKYLSNYKSGKPNYRAIAQEFDLGENQVKQIIKNIKAKLKKSLNSSDSVVVSKPKKSEPKTKKVAAKKKPVTKQVKKKLKTIFSVWLGREEI